MRAARRNRTHCAYDGMPSVAPHRSDKKTENETVKMICQTRDIQRVAPIVGRNSSGQIEVRDLIESRQRVRIPPKC